MTVLDDDNVLDYDGNVQNYDDNVQNYGENYLDYEGITGLVYFGLEVLVY